MITYETVMAKIGVSTTPEMNMIPTDLQEQFLKAQQVLHYVNEKQIGN